MPTYEYACRDCGEHLEVVQSFKDDALTTCPACKGQLRKVFSAAGLIFKGSGWHVKDYATSTRQASSTDSGASSADSPKKDTSSGDSSSKGVAASSSSEATTTSSAATTTSSGTSSGTSSEKKSA